MAFLHISGAEPKEDFLAQQMKMTERTFGNKGSYQNKFKTLKNYKKRAWFSYWHQCDFVITIFCPSNSVAAP